ncbi:UBX domain-containing protein 4 isoform X3 [Pieris rapae]|uniref:UBX domain-containing protein 4 isoform X3 n=1 Tax=Pieris rapae TaxID=64459 RepID=UPI001E27E1F6|nr:UBX domain-containing protein 4 isoform X3 [Pieris rapae]
MHWFGGTIAEAVTLSKQKNAIFVVFVEGDNDLSKELAATIDNGLVLKRLADPTNFLAIKLKSGTENYTYFAQIYQFVPVPSLFFIGNNGTPLEVVCAGVEAQNLAERIDRILEVHYQGKPVQPSTSKQNIKEETKNLLQSEAAATEKTATTPKENGPKTSEESEISGPAAKIPKTVHHEVTRSGTEYDVVCDGDVCVRKPKTGQDTPGPSHREDTNAETTMEENPVENIPDVNAEEKIERAKELIEARRREKAEKEKQLEREKELERRATGQGVAELKRWQAEQEFKQIQEERKREKMENNLARQRILEQIAQDRAERKAREQPQTQTATTPPAQTQLTSGDGSPRARVQFKMANGESHTAHFEASTTVEELHQYVADNLQMTRASFSLWTAFPRRELTENDATLRDLQLIPSVALLVLPRRSNVVSSSPSPFSSLIAFFSQLFSSMVLDPSYQLYTWIRSRLFGATNPTPTTGNASPGNIPPGNIPPSIRRRGNVHRLTGDRPDDDNNTWNGNSTQQM